MNSSFYIHCHGIADGQACNTRRYMFSIDYSKQGHHQYDQNSGKLQAKTQPSTQNKLLNNIIISTKRSDECNYLLVTVEK